jgi:hypothetical protein
MSKFQQYFQAFWSKKKEKRKRTENASSYVSIPVYSLFCAKKAQSDFHMYTLVNILNYKTTNFYQTHLFGVNPFFSGQRE